MILSINQPAYLPWLGYYERIASSDVHVILDHVQFEKNSFTNRNQILANGNPTLLTVPVRTKNKFGNLCINALQIDNSKPWHKKHWRTIQQAYSKAPYFEEHSDFFEDTFSKPWDLLVGLNRHINEHLLQAFRIKTPIIYSSDLQLSETKSALILEICTQLKVNHYLSGAMGVDYLDIKQFTACDTQVTFQNYAHPSYRQTSSRHQFTPNMSAIDLLFHHGPDSLDILLSSNK